MRGKKTNIMGDIADILHDDMISGLYYDDGPEEPGTDLSDLPDMKLTIELVPKTAWFTNVRSKVTQDEWDAIRQKCYDQAGRHCQVCGEQGPRWPVEAHEIWHYDDNTKVQRLAGIIALCPDCHKVKHAGFACLNGDQELVLNQLAKVNGTTKAQAKEYLRRAFEIWQERSGHAWTTDISYLEAYMRPSFPADI